MKEKIVRETVSLLNSNKEITSLDFELINKFLCDLSSHYYYNFAFRAVFDTFYKGGLRHDMVPPPQPNGKNFDDRIGESREIFLPHIFPYSKKAARNIVLYMP